MTLQDETTLTETTFSAPSDPSAIPLPEITRRKESRRRRLQRRKQRRRHVLLGVAGAVAFILLITLVVKVWPSSGPGANKDGTATNSPASPPASPPVLIAQQDGAGNAISLTLLVPAAKDKGGTLILVPPGTMAEVASLGLEPVGKSLSLGGAQRLDATMENLLGVTLGEVLVYDDSRLAGLVQPAGPLSVRLPERVEQVDPKGAVNVLYEPGLHKIQPADVPALLAVKGQGNDLTRLARHQAFWDAWLARLRQLPAAIPAQPPGLHKALAALAAGEVETRVLPVKSLGMAGTDGELYQVEAAEIRRMVGAVFPGSGPGAAVRPRLQILNGTGAVGLATKVADRLVPMGVEVKLTGNAGRLDYDTTQIVFYRRTDQATAQRVQKTLGMGRLVLSRNPLDVVDVTVIVGKDFQPQ
jgi:hypothetical protein